MNSLIGKLIRSSERILESFFSGKSLTPIGTDKISYVLKTEAIEWDIKQKMDFSDWMEQYLTDHVDTNVFGRLLRRIYFWLIICFEMDDIVYQSSYPGYLTIYPERFRRKTTALKEHRTLKVKFLVYYFRMRARIFLRSFGIIDCSLSDRSLHDPIPGFVKIHPNNSHKIRGPSLN